MSESWKRIAALVTALGISSSEGDKSVPPEAPSKIDAHEIQKSGSVPRSSHTFDSRGVERSKDEHEEAEQVSSEFFQVEDMGDLLKEFFPDLKEKSSNMLLGDFAKTLQPNDIYMEQLGGFGIAVSRLQSAYEEGSGPVDTQKILEITVEQNEEGDNVYSMKSGISIQDSEAQGENGTVPLFSFEEVNPTQESMHAALQKMIDAEAKFQETDPQLGDEREENMLKLQTAILKIDEFLQTPNENSPESSIFLDSRAQAFLQSRRAGYEELLHALQTQTH